MLLSNLGKQITNKASEGEVVIHIHADKSLPYGEVVSIFSYIKKLEITQKWSLVTRE